MKLALCIAVLVGRASAQVTGQCAGNTDPAEDVACDQDRHLIEPSTAGTTESDCCEDDTPCAGAWSTCAANCADKVYTVTAPATGAGAPCEAAADATANCAVGEGDCVAAVQTVTGKCTGNTDATENVACPSGIPLSADATGTGLIVSEAVELVATDADVSRETCTGEIADADMDYIGDTCEQNFEANGGSGDSACAASCTHDASLSDIAVVVAVRESLGMSPSSNPGELRANLAEICYHRDLDPGWEYWTRDGTIESECCAPEACNRACQARMQADAAKAALQKCKNITVAENATSQQEAQAKLDCVAEELGLSAGTIAGIVVASLSVLAWLAYCVVTHLCCSNDDEEFEDSGSGSEDEETGRLNKNNRSKVDSGSESGSEGEEMVKKSRSKADSGSGSDSGSEGEETNKNSRSKADSGSDSGSASEDEPPEPKQQPEPPPEPEPEPKKDHHHHHHHHHHKHSDSSDGEERSASPERARASSPERHHHDHHDHHHHRDHHHHDP
jgi:hypothetical protein